MARTVDDDAPTPREGRPIQVRSLPPERRSRPVVLAGGCCTTCCCCSCCLHLLCGILAATIAGGAILVASSGTTAAQDVRVATEDIRKQMRARKAANDAIASYWKAVTVATLCLFPVFFFLEPCLAVAVVIMGFPVIQLFASLYCWATLRKSVDPVAARAAVSTLTKYAIAGIALGGLGTLIFVYTLGV